MANSILNRNPNFQSPQNRWVSTQLNQMVSGPVQNIITYTNTLQKVGILFAILVATAIFSWVMLPDWSYLVFLVAGLVLGIINSFKRNPSPALISLYAIAEGGLLGVISRVYESSWGGIVFQAFIATIAVIGAMLCLFVFGKFRATAKMNKIFLVALLAYVLYGLVNMILTVTGVVDAPFGINGLTWNGFPIGIIIGAFAVILASYSLIQDFTLIENAVQNQAPARQGWYAGFALMVTVVWMYLEMLRLMALSRR